MRKNVIPWIVSHLAAIISILFLPSGCLKEEVPYLTLSAEGEIEMDYDGGAFTVEVKTNQSWTAVSDAAWCAVSGGEGSYKGEFVITVEPNDGISGRKANITVSGGLCSEVITIVQTSQEADFSVSASEITFVNGADVSTGLSLHPITLGKQSRLLHGAQSLQTKATAMPSSTYRRRQTARGKTGKQPLHLQLILEESPLSGQCP